MFNVPKRGASGAAGLARTAAAPSSFTRAYPSLAEFLEVEVVDGTARTPGSLLLFWGDGRYKAMLKDLDGRHVCFVSGSSVSDALDAANRVLETGDGDWREDRKQAVPPKRG